jgi:methylaspartate mutase sigma subunit
MTDTPVRKNTLDRSAETVVVTSMASDSHTWNLVFLQLLIEELGYRAVNLGPCVPDDLLVSQCREIDPVMVIISSVNGHGYQDGIRVIGQLRADDRLATTPILIGGKLGITGGENTSYPAELVAAGFDAVFEDSAESIATFRDFVEALPGAALATADQIRILV